MKTNKTSILKEPSAEITGEKALEIFKNEISSALKSYLNATGKKHGKVMAYSGGSRKDIVIDLDGEPYTSFSVAVSIDINGE